MACPHVSAVAALIWASNKILKNSDVRDKLKATALDLIPEGKDSRFGYGLVDAYKAVAFSGAPSIPPEPPTPPTPTKNLKVQVSTDKPQYFRIDQGVITVNVTDTGTKPINSATVEVTILRFDGEIAFSASGTTDKNGLVQFKFGISHFRFHRSVGYLPGNYTVKAEATKSGYESGSGQTTFEVSSSTSRIVKRDLTKIGQSDYFRLKNPLIQFYDLIMRLRDYADAFR
jgi:hypothetical protein